MKWILTAPERLPATGSLRDYVEKGSELGVSDAPSVAAFGPAWWHRTWRETQIAVQIHPAFLHQVWWSEEPFVAKNNFHVLAFDDSVPGQHRELAAASLSSAFGALSALFITSDVGDEGVRWLSTAQFELWPVLLPMDVSRSEADAVLAAHRLFRKLPAQEINKMDGPTRKA